VALAAGILVNDNIRLTAPLGEGAMGSVWTAQHLTLKTEVAVKFISPELASQHPDLIKRFEREATVSAQVKSPHVVQVFDHGLMADGTPYIVMELLEGQSLMEMLEAQGPLPVAQAAQVLVQVARALSKAHAIGIVHRDIKPDNIFVTPGEDGLFCKILDFGIAKQTKLPQMGGLTSHGMLIGTPEYMSPEQVHSSKDVDHRADLWGLAVSMYQTLTGVLPFVAEALGELCVKLLAANFEPPSHLRPDLPPAIDAWFARALAREPEQRFASARDMAQAFVGCVPTTTMAEAMGLSTVSPVQPPQLGGSWGMASQASTLGGSSADLQRAGAARPRSSALLVALSLVGLLLVGGGIAVAVALSRGDESRAAPSEAGSAAASEQANTADDSTPPADGSASSTPAPDTTAPAQSADSPPTTASAAAKPTASTAHLAKKAKPAPATSKPRSSTTHKPAPPPRPTPSAAHPGGPIVGDYGI